MNVQALAHCGLTLTDDSGHIDNAIMSFRAARAITTAPGILGRTLRLLDAIAAADSAGTLNAVRVAAISQ